MELTYSGKMPKEAILHLMPKISLDINDADRNLLIQGDNLDVLSCLLHKYGFAGKVDLIYIDPPFATNSTFAVGEERTSTISSSRSDKVAYSDRLTGSDFIEFLRERLIVARELLSDSGSIYLHIDYKIGHYVKIIMDEVFGEDNFRNDITRIKCNPKNFSRCAYGNIKDMILFYSKGTSPIWHEPYIPYTDDDVSRLYKKTDKDGRLYTTVPLHAPGETQDGVTGGAFKGIMPPKGRHWRTSPAELEKLDAQGGIEWSSNGVPRRKIYADEGRGKKMQDIWDFKGYQYPVYPTEKNLDLLKHIITTSSNEDSIVMDFFCGSGTTLVAAQELGRRWIGVDASPVAISAATERLYDAGDSLFGGSGYECITATGGFNLLPTSKRQTMKEPQNEQDIA